MTVSEPVAARRTLLANLGLRVLDPAVDDIAAELRATSRMDGADVAIDAVGSSATVGTALSATAPGGRCVLGAGDGPAGKVLVGFGSQPQ